MESEKLEESEEKKTRSYLAYLSLGALGVVYGDIGTSPLYALRECFSGETRMAVEPANILGVLSLILWSLLFVITFKYITFVMRADNRGEGGILALLSLIYDPSRKNNSNYSLILIGLFGAALLYGDGIITPAISVLSAVEGIHVATPALESYVVPITVVILIGLFYVQQKGTGKIGIVFGPIMLLWFFILGISGLVHIFDHPDVIRAMNPYYGYEFFVRHGLAGVVVMGSVFLVVTGGEAIYADMGHFGRRPIQIAWFSIVLPGLILNYFGQGAMLLSQPDAISNPFFRMFPAWSLFPMVFLSTLATCIASQAVITGAYSLTFQAIQIGYLPRMRIQHTSVEEMGQIYIPEVNWVLLFSTVALVLRFKSSENLASAYGMAVTTTMLITTILVFVAMRKLWKWHLIPSLALTAIFLVVDLGFFSGNVIKIEHGGWLPLVIGLFVFTLMSTWWKGRKILGESLQQFQGTFESFLDNIRKYPPNRVPGTAIYMTRNPDLIPHALYQNLTLNKVLHEQVVFLTVQTEPVPRVSGHNKVEVKELAPGFIHVVIHHGFLNNPNVPAIIRSNEKLKWIEEAERVVYFLGRETIMHSLTKRSKMSYWREELFGFMSRNALEPTLFFHLPSDRVIEIGAQVRLEEID